MTNAFAFPKSIYRNSKSENIMKTLSTMSVLNKKLKPSKTLYDAVYINKIISEDYDKKKIAECKAKTDSRLKYLESVLDEEQDYVIFKYSKKTALKFAKEAKLSDYPMIGVDNTGYIGFEWRNFKNYKTVMILFNTDETASLTGIKLNSKNKADVIEVSGSLDFAVQWFNNL